MDVGDGIKGLRENAGMTQAELGKVAGVSSNAVSQWENKRAVPRMGAIQRIADYFGIPKSMIMGDSMAVMEDATPEERALLMFFRSCSPRGKSNILEYSEDMAPAPRVPEIEDVRARIGRIERAIEEGVPFDAERLMALHARLEELERSEAAESRHRFERGQVMALLESAAQMDPQRAIDVFVSCVVWDGDGAAVEFAFDGAPTVADGRLAQVQDWWSRRGVKPTPRGFAVYAVA